MIKKILLLLCSISLLLIQCGNVISTLTLPSPIELLPTCEDLEYYITIQTNNGFMSSHGSTFPVNDKINKQLSLTKEIKDEEYYYLTWGTNIKSASNLKDTYTNDYSLTIDNLWGTELYSIKNYSKYFFENITNEYISNSLLYSPIHSKSSKPFYFKINFLSIPCDNSGNVNNEILYPVVTDNMVVSSECSSIQFGFRFVTITSLSSGYMVSVNGSMEAWEFGLKKLKTDKSALSDFNYFKVLPFQDNKIGFEDKFTNVWSFDKAKIYAGRGLFYNSKFNLIPVGNDQLNTYYIKTDTGYVKEDISNGSLLNYNGQMESATKFKIQVMPCRENSKHNIEYGSSHSYNNKNTDNNNSNQDKIDTNPSIATLLNINGFIQIVLFLVVIII